MKEVQFARGKQIKAQIVNVDRSLTNIENITKVKLVRKTLQIISIDDIRGQMTDDLVCMDLDNCQGVLIGNIKHALLQYRARLEKEFKEL